MKNLLNDDKQTSENQQDHAPIVGVVCNATPQIQAWLDADDSGRIWKQGENPNLFTNNRLEALYVYDNHIKYWEDIRAKSSFVKHRIPESKNELYLII